MRSVTMKLVLSIENLSTNGDGISRHEGKVVFIPFTLPGESWLVEIVEEKKSFNRALPLHLVSEAEQPPLHRVEAPCSYFGTCGGCQLQHIEDSDHGRLKQDWLKETFQRIAHLEVEPMATVRGPVWEYRNKVIIPIAQIGEEITLAYHRMNNPKESIPIADCPIAHGKIRKAIPALNEVLQREHPLLQSYHNSNRPGSRIQLRVQGDALHAVFFDMEMANEFSAAHTVQSLIHENRILETISFPWGEGYRRNYDTQGFNTVEDNRALGAFRQVNSSVADSLYEHIAALPFEKNNSCMEGYCGTGDLTIRLVNRFVHIDGVEQNEEAVYTADANAKQQGIGDRIDWHLITVERYLEICDREYNVMILNPPRAGLSKKARQLIQKRKQPEIVLVSCHPAALARDARVFVDAGYQIQSLTPFDMFPQTYHLEAVLHLKHT